MSLRSFIAKRISYPVQDLVNGTSILSTLEELDKSQYWPLEKQKSYQFEKFLKLLHHSIEHVPFYREQFKEMKLTLSDIKEPSDIRKIPMLTKVTAREQHQKLIAQDIDRRKVFKGTTGGTTGPPLKLLWDVQDKTCTWAAFYRWYRWMGLEYGDSYVQIWGTPMVLHTPYWQKIRASVKDFYYNRHIINSFQLNERTLPGVLEKIEKFRPLFLRGYLSAFIQLSDYMLRNNIRLSFVPRALSSTTETLFPVYKRMIEKAFNAKLYDQYGCGECNSISFDAGKENGMYIVTEHAFLEILDEQDRVTDLEKGRIIVTNLDNYAMPFIRYENGDEGRFAAYDEASIIKLPVLGEVLGRTADTILLNDGSRVHGVFFTDILSELFEQHPESIHRFQVFQHIPGKIEFRIEKADPVDNAYITGIHDALKRFFTEVKIVTMPVLPNDKTGKFRYIISDCVE